MSEPDASKDYYSILGAAEDATQSDIERHYRRKAVLHHPDLGGCEEEMKTVNEAYRVLRDEGSRQTYDQGRQLSSSTPFAGAKGIVASGEAGPVQLDAVTHQVLAALMFIVLGLVLLFIVRFQYVIFLWPLALLAAAMVLVGIVQAHSALDTVRKQIEVNRPQRSLLLVQEGVFWTFVVGGGYGVYLLLTAD